MEREKLTKTLVEGIKAGSKDIVVWDREVKGFGLKVTPTGTVPLNNQAYEILRKHYKSKNGDFVIKSATGQGRPALGKPWERIRGRANIDRTANINSLRHTFASWSVMGGLSLPQTGALLGHKSAQTTLRYADHLTQAIRGYSQQTANLIAAD